LDYGIRWSLMPDAWLDDNKLASFDPASTILLWAPLLQRHYLGEGRAQCCQDRAFAGVSIPRIAALVLRMTTYRTTIGFAWTYSAAATLWCAERGQFLTRDPISGTSHPSRGANPRSRRHRPERTLDGPFVAVVVLARSKCI